jgi:hypothetical protein
MAHEMTCYDHLVAYVRLVYVDMTHHGPLFVAFGY